MKVLLIGGNHNGLWLDVHPGCVEVRFPPFNPRFEMIEVQSPLFDPYFEVIRKDLFMPEWPQMQVYKKSDMAKNVMSDAVVFTFAFEI